MEGQGAFASLLREFRTAANITQEELAERSGLSLQAIAALERGARRSPRPSTVEWLASALKLDAQQKQALVQAARGRPASYSAYNQAPVPTPAPARKLADSEGILASSTADTGDDGTCRRDTRVARRVTTRVKPILIITTLSAASVTVPMDIVIGRPPSAVAALIAVVAASALLSVNAWCRSLPSDRPKYDWQRWTAAVVASAMVAALALVGIDSEMRDAARYDVLGFPRPESSQLTIASGNGKYRIQIPISNGHGNGDQVASIAIRVKWIAGTNTCLPSDHVYQLQDHLLIGDGGRSLRAVITDLVGPLAELSLQATGTLTRSCASSTLDFTFRPGLVIAGRSTSLIYVDIPQRITVIDDRGITEATTVPDPIDGAREDDSSFVFIRSVVIMTSGATYSSCGAVHGVHSNIVHGDGC